MTSDKISLETRRGGNIYIYRELQKNIQISLYLCITYGIVIIEIYNCNKGVISIKYSCIVSFFILANNQRKENPKMSVVYCSAPTYIYI